MKLGERIQVKTRNFEGYGTVMYIAPGEIYPVQIEMDQADPDGHKIQRIAFHEIVSEHAAEITTAAVVFAGPDDPQQYVGQVIQEQKGYSFKNGQKLILGVVSYPGTFKPGTAKNFYAYCMESQRFMGCMPATMFQINGPYIPETIEQPVSLPDMKELPFIEPMIESRQMSFFDFI